MNPAALRANIDELERGATIIVNEDAFTKRNLQKAGYEANPLDDGSLESYTRPSVPMNTLCQRAMEGIEGVSSRDALRAKNLFALGLLSWLYDRPTDVTEGWIEQKFARNRPALEANLTAFRAGWSFGETTELIDIQIRVAAARDIAPGHLPHRQRHDRDRARPDRGERAQRAAARVRVLPDHAGVRAAARARAPPPGRRAHDPGRGRDRRRRDGARRRLRGRARRHGDERPGDGPQGRDDRARGDARAADADHRRPARRARRPGCRPRPSSPTC